MTSQTEAYYAGRNSWFPGEPIPGRAENPYRGNDELSAAWVRGLRHVLAEERLNADTEWDAEAGA